MQYGGPGDIPVPFDYLGVGRFLLAVFRPQTGGWFVRTDSSMLVLQDPELQGDTLVGTGAKGAEVRVPLLLGWNRELRMLAIGWLEEPTAKELIEQGERAAVLHYLEICLKLWPRGENVLRIWIADIKNGRTPNLGVP